MPCNSAAIPSDRLALDPLTAPLPACLVSPPQVRGVLIPGASVERPLAAFEVIADAMSDAACLATAVSLVPVDRLSTCPATARPRGTVQSSKAGTTQPTRTTDHMGKLREQKSAVSKAAPFQHRIEMRCAPLRGLAASSRTDQRIRKVHWSNPRREENTRTRADVTAPFVNHDSCCS